MLNLIKHRCSSAKAGTAKFDTFTKRNQVECPKHPPQSTAIIGSANALC